MRQYIKVIQNRKAIGKGEKGEKYAEKNVKKM